MTNQKTDATRLADLANRFFKARSDALYDMATVALAHLTTDQQKRLIEDLTNRGLMTPKTGD